MPNGGVIGGIGTYVSTGTLPAGGHFVIDEQTAPGADVFAGLAAIPLGYSDTRVAPLRLYVDGKLIASKEVTYSMVTRPK